ncbi:hypothetical protein GCM10017643_29690 [Ancylobacter dichloromethanicus]|uniref:Uncharacterized protein n=1 Tax=Ancylobacter dichloromethanicus TaxID=518825 RepID=A0A9W6N064_9HYPH|nr:hypothetical protein GCM10017643_29690 [Ancylobacter dichloromethanicus]
MAEDGDGFVRERQAKLVQRHRDAANIGRIEHADEAHHRFSVEGEGMVGPDPRAAYRPPGTVTGSLQGRAFTLPGNASIFRGL